MSDNFAQPTVIIIVIIIIMTPKPGHESPVVDPGLVRPFWNWSSISLDSRDMINTVNTTDTTCRGLALP